MMYQPNQTGSFYNSHSNDRTATVQNFMLYSIDEGQLTARLYEVSGNIHEGEERSVALIDTFGITKE